jgi:hypothetical protein
MSFTKLSIKLLCILARLGPPKARVREDQGSRSSRPRLCLPGGSFGFGPLSGVSARTEYGVATLDSLSGSQGRKVTLCKQTQGPQSSCGRPKPLNP